MAAFGLMELMEHVSLEPEMGVMKNNCNMTCVLVTALCNGVTSLKLALRITVMAVTLLVTLFTVFTHGLSLF